MLLFFKLKNFKVILYSLSLTHTQMGNCTKTYFEKCQITFILKLSWKVICHQHSNIAILRNTIFFHVTSQRIFSIDNILLLIFPFLFYENFIFVLFFSQEISKQKKNILQVVLVCGPTNGSLVMSSESVLSTVCPLQGVSCPLKLAIPSRQVEHRIYCVPRSVVD